MMDFKYPVLSSGFPDSNQSKMTLLLQRYDIKIWVSKEQFLKLTVCNCITTRSKIENNRLVHEVKESVA